MLETHVMVGFVVAGVFGLWSVFWLLVEQRIAKMKSSCNVSEIKVEMKADGSRAVAIFATREKIRDLLEDRGSLGKFLRDLRDSASRPPFAN